MSNVTVASGISKSQKSPQKAHFVFWSSPKTLDATPERQMDIMVLAVYFEHTLKCVVIRMGRFE